MREIKAGTVWINDPLTDNDAGPFGGMKQSGLGRELGQEGLEAFQETKHVHIETKIAPKEWWYPYGPGGRARRPAPGPERRRASARRPRQREREGGVLVELEVRAAAHLDLEVREHARARARASARSAFLARATVFLASQGGALSASVTFCSGMPDSSSAAARCTSRRRRMIGKTSRPGRSPYASSSSASESVSRRSPGDECVGEVVDLRSVVGGGELLDVRRARRSSRDAAARAIFSSSRDSRCWLWPTRATSSFAASWSS